MKRRGKGGRKGREREGRREGRRRGEIGMYRRLCISAGMGPLTLKLFASYGDFARSAPLQTHGFILVSHWSSMYLFILSIFDEELPSRRISVIQQRIPTYYVCIFVYCEGTTQVLVNSYLY